MEKEYMKGNQLSTCNMKRNAFLILLAMLCCSVASAQPAYTVPTTVSKKKILLEEFTGANCFWCSEGHKMAKYLLRAFPDSAYVVNIHTGGYAPTTGYEGGFRIAEGDSIGREFNADEAGYPSGMVNRHDFGQYTLSRSLWRDAAEILHAEDAPVNLQVRSAYDGQTGKLTVHVEGYFTAAKQAADQRLNVIWTQDDIIGYQNNGGRGDDYHHQHMLRGFISPLWGDVISNARQGEYFSKDYEMTLPEDVKGVKALPEDIQVIGFITTGRDEVLNVDGGKPSYSNYAESEAGELYVPDMTIGTRYGFNFFETYLKNHSTRVITSATFDVTVNGITTETTIDCQIGQFETSGILHVPANLTFAEKGKTKYEVKLTKLNGVPVEGSSISGGFQAPIYTNSSVKVQIATDFKSSDNLFRLLDGDGNVLKVYGPFDDGKQSVVEEEISNLEEGKTYCIEIYDETGDGLLEGAKGYLITRTGTNKLIDQIYTISNFGTRSFFTVNTEAVGISHTETSADESAKDVYDLSGRRVDSPRARNIYIIGKEKKLLPR